MGGTDPLGWVGSTIDGQFVVEAVAGEGAFGVVYRGAHLGFEAPIAIKCLKIPAAVGGEQRDVLLAKFREEARLLHRLSRLTTGVVQAFHVGAATTPGGVWTPYIVMEWLDGETLEADLRQRRASGLGPRSVDEAIAFLSPVAGALALAHREKVSHRDVKPANLFLVKHGSNSPLKVLDFGVAKVFAETPSITAALAQTGSGFRAFTPQYGAPEQFSPRYGATGPWTDVFAMALVLIEVASGRPALMGSDLPQFFTSSSDPQHRPSLAACGVTASPALEAVLQRALAVTPSLRFVDLGTMWAAVREAQGALPPAFDGARTLDAGASALHPESTPTVPSLATTGENRVCTVMFVDLSEVTALSARIGAEEVKAILDLCHDTVRALVEDLGGFVESPAGDRVMAVFGIPAATDNDAERAVSAALRIQAAIARTSLPRSVRSARPSARIGITTGRVFAEAEAGGARRELVVVGDAVHAAARLQQAAARGTIVIGRDTYRLVAGRFDVTPLSPVEAAERGEALQAYRIVAPVAARQSLSSADFCGLETTLVGRASERRRLLDALETVLSESKAQLVTLVGPPGVGRSRLLADLASSLFDRRDATLVIAAQCSPLDKDISYGLAASLIRQSFEIHEDDMPEGARRKLRRGIRWIRMSRRRISGEIAEIEGADLDDALTQIATILGARSSGRTDRTMGDEAVSIAKSRIVTAVVRLFGLFASRCPIVVLCDDIQWADGASLDLLEEIVARVEGLPILLVGSARPEFDELRPRWAADHAARERIDVAPLARRHIEEMIRDRLRLAIGLSPDLVRTLADRAEGNPLTLVETLHLLVDAGIVETTSEGPWRVHEERLGALALPATIHGLVQARLDRLDAEARDTLERAAVIGRSFWEGALERLRRASAPALGTSNAKLLATLRERQLVRAREPSTLPGEREYVFAESATREVAYDMLSAKLRRMLHLLVAEWLEAQGHAAAALLALHYDRGGDLVRAAEEYTRAGVHAASLGENTEALRLLDRARQIHDESEGVEEDEERRIARWTSRVRLRLELGDVLRRVGRLDEATRIYEEARARIVRVERRGTAPQDRAAPLRWDARADFRLAHIQRLLGATSGARQLVERAIQRAGEAGAPDETPPMYALLAFLHRRERRPEASLAAALAGLRTCRAAKRRDDRWREDVAQLLFGVGTALFGLGRTAGMERSYRQALRLIDETKQPHLAGIALNGMAGARFARGDLRGTRDLVARSLRLKERVGDLHQIAIACNNLAEVELRLGNVLASLDHARRSVRLGEQVRARYDLADFYRNLAEALLAAGLVEEALDALRAALSIAETTGRVYLGDVAVALARGCVRASEVERLRGRAEEAAEALRRSLSKHFDEGDLRRKAEECTALLARMLIGGPRSSDAPRSG